MKLETTFLRSKVARRIFLLFVTCALVPVVAITLTSFYQVSGQLRANSRRQLAESAKSQGMAIYGRLALLDTEIKMASMQTAAGNSPALTEQFRGHYVDALTVNTPALAANGQAVAGFSRAEQRHLLEGKSLLRVQACSRRVGMCVALVHLISSDRLGGRLLLADLDPDYLWPGESLPNAMDACIFDARQTVLSCPSGRLPPFSPAEAQSSNSFLSWKSQRAAYDSAYWNLFLRPQFLVAPWVIVLTQRHEDALAPMVHFRQTFPFIILLAVWTVILVSLIQIRRTLVPLEKLQEGTRKIGAQKFDSRVEVHSGDEFEALADSFNSMTTRLGRQFHALKTIHDIDQAILASLNREGIVEAVLGHMPYLLPCDSFAITLFQSATPASARTRFTVQTPSGDSIIRTLNTPLSSRDLEQLQNHPEIILIADGEATPGFVVPLKTAGLASFFVLPILVEHKVFAALVCAHRGSLDVGPEDIQRARQVADQLAVAFSNVQLIEALEQLHLGTLTALARAIDAKSAWTAGHSERVTNLAVRIGRYMGLPPNDLAIMHRGGLLHDIGKIGTPPTVLDKPGKLDPDELNVMRDHVRIGLRILEPIPGFQDALPIVAHHHEWFDGSGYPEGLAGEQISLYGRIFAVADCYDAMTSDRPYRKGMPWEQVLNMLRQKSGTQFDPQVIDAFVQMCEQDGLTKSDSQFALSAAT
jgi:putative nucleotidyltransferase with HDIG domain